MKKMVILLTFLGMGLLNLPAQVTLQPGATWLFRSQLWGVKYGEKWEYQGTSGSVVTMQVTTKCLGNPPVCTTPLSVTTKEFLVTGDKIQLDGITVADFSLHIGDSTDSPYAHNSFQDSICGPLYMFPATVIESGMETVNGQASRYYVIRYLHGATEDDSLWATRKYSEYTWITNMYWYFADEWPFSIGCPIMDPYVYRNLACYYDNQFAVPAVCSQDWFDKMGVEETDISKRISVFPNPITDLLNVNLPENDGHWHYKILSADGKQLSNGNLGNGQVQVATLSSGMYFLLLDNGSRTGRVPFVKQ